MFLALSSRKMFFSLKSQLIPFMRAHLRAWKEGSLLLTGKSCFYIPNWRRGHRFSQRCGCCHWCWSWFESTVFYRFCKVGFSILWNWLHWISRFLNIMTIIVLHNSVCYTVFVWRFFTLYCKKFNVCLKKDQKKQKINFEWAIFNKPTYKKTVKYHRANTTIVSWISLRDVKYVSTSAYFIQVNIIVTRIDDNLLNTTYHADCCRQCDQ